VSCERWQEPIACSAHWAAENPPPDVAQWTQIADPDQRLQTALDELYAFYRCAGNMLDKLLRDEAAVPVVGQLMGAYHQHLPPAPTSSWPRKVD
jgi:hypothetical protein